MPEKIEDCLSFCEQLLQRMCRNCLLCRILDLPSVMNLSGYCVVCVR